MSTEKATVICFVFAQCRSQGSWRTVLTEVARGGCSITCNFSVTGSTVLRGLKEDQGRRTSGTRRDFLGTGHSLLSQFSISFARPTSLYCKEYVYINTYRTVYEVPLLANNPTGEIFLREHCKVLTGYLSLVCRPGGDWGE